MHNPTLPETAAAASTTAPADAEVSRRKIEPPYYPIVYVRGYAMTHGEREDTFHDTYYGFAATSVERRDAPAPRYFEVDMFEGQFIRFMKLDRHYADATNRGLGARHTHPARSIWICRFYDEDYVREEVRDIIDHARDLRKLICETIPAELKAGDVDLGENDQDYKVILIAHSMGGLVCRTLIQNLLPEDGQDPRDWIHRFVTIGTPHRGIDMGRLPDFIENPIVHLSNLFNSGIFKHDRMRQYLKLSEDHDVHSLGGDTGPTGQPIGCFPPKRCLNIIGSDYSSYSAVRHATGGFSDGLVKQSHAYVVAGPRPPNDDPYPDARRAFWANVHRAHSGRRGIVNSYESFENIHRFLFGNIVAQLSLEDVAVRKPAQPGITAFYDVEFSLTIRGTSTYLHRRQQDPCENAMRFTAEEIEDDAILLHTTFMNSDLKVEPDDFSHFAVSLKVIERRVKDRLLWDRHYPGRPIYEQALEIRVGDADPDQPGEEVEYRSFADADDGWKIIRPESEPGTDSSGPRKAFRIGISGGDAFSGTLVIRAGKWPDPQLTRD